SDYDERTILNSFRFSFSIGGGIFSLIVATIISVLIPDSPDSTYQEYLVLGGVCAILSVIPLFWCFLGTRKRVWSRHSTSGNQDNSDSLPLVEQIKIALSNRPFLLVIGIYLCSWLGVQLTASILAYFVINWMGLPKVMFPLMAMVVQGTSLVMLFVWSAISKRYGKKSIYFMGMGLWIIAQAGLFFLQPGQVSLMYILAILAGCGVSTAYLVPWSMIPDVIDLDELNTGQRREGVFYSFMVFLQKIGLAVGLFLVGQSLGFAGFQPTTPDNPVPIQPDSALLAIRLAISLLPTLFLVIGMIFTFLYPITKEVHADILLRLSEKKRRQNLD
ncbi:MAG TPA: MFS transporter, partial [Planktothrix sp. UBA8402]|nr:MFS transporter [Planktothrix sp. UBA8402]